MPASQAFAAMEYASSELAGWLRLMIESAGILVIAAGAAGALVALARAGIAGQAIAFTQIRLRFARYLALALEFQLAADIVDTGIAPSWQKIAQLAAIASIRTALNYFLSRDMRDEGRTSAE